MQEILAKHAPHAAQSPKEKSDLKVWPTANGTPPDTAAHRPTPVTLQWQRPEAGSMGVRTVCENYSCCKVMLDGVWQYEVWTREPLTGGMKQIALNLPSFAEGQKVAQAHANGEAP